MKKVQSANCEVQENASEQESHSYNANEVNHFFTKEETRKTHIDKNGPNEGGKNDTSRHNDDGGEATSLSDNPNNNNGPNDSTGGDVEDKIVRKYLSKRMSNIGLNIINGSDSAGGDGGGNGSGGGGAEGQSHKRPCEPPADKVNVISDSDDSDGDDVPLLKTIKIEQAKMRVKMGDTAGISSGDAVAKMGVAILKKRNGNEGTEKVKNIKRSRINGHMQTGNKDRDADPESDASSDDQYLINLINKHGGSDDFQGSKNKHTAKQKDAARRLKEKASTKTKISEGGGKGSDSSTEEDSTSSCDSDQPILVKSKIKNQLNSTPSRVGNSNDRHSDLVQKSSSNGDTIRSKNKNVHRKENNEVILNSKGSAQVVVVVNSSAAAKKKNESSKHKKGETKEKRKKSVVTKKIKKGSKGSSDSTKRRDKGSRKNKQKRKYRHSSGDDFENSLSQSNDIETDSIIIGTFDPHNRTPKEKLVAQLLIRWWYVLPEWPTPDFNYEPELTKRKLRLVPLEVYEDEEDINKEGFRKVYEISAFPGVFRDATGTAYDLRDKESCPSYNNFMKKTELELLELICQAIKNQMESLKKSVYSESATEKTLERELKDAEVKLNKITKKKATKTKAGEDILGDHELAEALEETPG
ncbi:hypothetical protein AK88_00729 [Plasmodium fragile]|uniref:Uncharacterized protein n=1 Tax=Plasmodium fragile TaxID=5857 RepID=A0A0D9QRD7_PLAFR|nr:uncharacterized protein AK88_00729 [Plasmodium fragile]KJP89518.1 hypothetical protein AK88_00729 [Plasmodium fragile]